MLEALQKQKDDPMSDAKSKAVTRETLVAALNEDLAREYQAIIAYTVYSQVITGAQYMNIAKELEKHAAEELKHAIMIAHQIDYLGGGSVKFAHNWTFSAQYQQFDSPQSAFFVERNVEVGLQYDDSGCSA